MPILLLKIPVVNCHSTDYIMLAAEPSNIGETAVPSRSSRDLIRFINSAAGEKPGTEAHGGQVRHNQEIITLVRIAAMAFFKISPIREYAGLRYNNIFSADKHKINLASKLAVPGFPARSRVPGRKSGPGSRFLPGALIELRSSGESG
jgi:hypothetical protein